MLKRYSFFIVIAVLVFSINTEAAKPIKVIGAGLGAVSKAPFHQVAGSSVTLSRDTNYVLTGFYYVDSTATLNIQSGTVIFGDSATNATLVIRRGGKIFAEGTKTSPILFTSKLPAGQRKRGDWGGVIILGSAPTNKPTSTKIEGVDEGGEYGGSIANDNSGIFRFVRIEYPGIVISLNNEVNGLTLGGVGSGTTIDHIQVSYSNDDSFEWFGGTVDAKYLVALAGTDDDFDTDYGYIGRIQFGFAKRNQNFWDAAGQSNSFESDNDGTPTLSTPFTAPVFSNMTIVGPQADTNILLPTGNKFEYGAVIRRNTQMSIHNSVILGYPFGISIRNDSTASFAIQNILQVRNVSLQARTNATVTSTVAAGVGFNFGNWFASTGWNNLGGTPRQSSAIGLVDVFNTVYPDPRPAVNSEAVTAGTSFASSQVSSAFFTNTSYRGAFDPAIARDAQWDFGWTNYNPQFADYSNGVTNVNENVSTKIPVEYNLSQNFPNPFNPSTTINFNIPVSGNVTVKVFDMIGQEIATLVNEYKQAGFYTATFNGDKLSSGIYFYTLKSGNFNSIKKMLLVK